MQSWHKGGLRLNLICSTTHQRKWLLDEWSRLIGLGSPSQNCRRWPWTLLVCLSGKTPGINNVSAYSYVGRSSQSLACTGPPCLAAQSMRAPAFEEFGNLAQDMHNLVICMAISLPQSWAPSVRGPTDLGAMMLTDELAARAHHSIDSPAPGWQAHWPLLSHVLKTAAV